MTPILIGYFPKQTLTSFCPKLAAWRSLARLSGRPSSRQTELLEVSHVEEICSVGTHISSGPDDWMDAWVHNEFWAYDTPELAWSVVADESRAQFDLYAWRIFPVRFSHGEEESLEISDLAVEPLAPAFVRLGLDAVSRHEDAPFGCSPLSCNYLAREVTVNQYCLMESEAEAWQVARDFSRTEPEPGPYYLIEVWRAANKQLSPSYGDG